MQPTTRFSKFDRPRTPRTRLLLTTAVAAITVSLSATAIAQGGNASADTTARGRSASSFYERGVAPPSSRSTITTQRRVIIDGQPRTLEVSIVQGQMSASIDGAPVAPDRILLRDGLIEVRDENGRLIEQIRLGAAPPAVLGEPGATFLDRMRSVAPDDRFDGRGADAPAPRAMLGVHLADPDEALRSHLGLVPGEATIITRVIDGLAAAAGGLRVHDVIVAIDGKRPASVTAVRDAIAAAEPGTSIRVQVIRAAKPHETTVRLMPFDRIKMAPRFRTDAIDQTLRERVGANLHLEILDDVDDRLRRTIFLAPTSLETEVELDDPLRRRIGEMRDGEMILQAVPERRDGDSFPGVDVAWTPAVLAAEHARLRAIEASIEALTDRLDRLIERLGDR